MKHLEFIREIATHLIQQPVGSIRTKPRDNEIQLLSPKIPRPARDWKRYPKLGYCTYCKDNAVKRPSNGKAKNQATQPLRKALIEVDLNTTYTQRMKDRKNRKKRLRSSQTCWGCKAPECAGLRACKTGTEGLCWLGMSSLHSSLD